jgi:putative phosphoserine phosphatase/1-acylglycerol-3-phosphate O-acyltransferase
MFARSGIVEVEVLPPVDTSGWSRRTMGVHAEEVRALYLEALGQS